MAASTCGRTRRRSSVQTGYCGPPIVYETHYQLFRRAINPDFTQISIQLPYEKSKNDGKRWARQAHRPLQCEDLDVLVMRRGSFH